VPSGFRFNKEFEDLVKQKHTDADRLSDLNTRVDELIRELVKIHLVLNPAAAAAAEATDDIPAAGGADPPAAGGRSSMAGAGGGSGASTAREGAADGRGDVASAAQLAADLGAGRMVPYWSPEETLEEVLLKIQPGEVKVGGPCTQQDEQRVVQ
jgi:hypothetical protein